MSHASDPLIALLEECRRERLVESYSIQEGKVVIEHGWIRVELKPERARHYAEQILKLVRGDERPPEEGSEEQRRRDAS